VRLSEAMHKGQHGCPDRPESYMTFLEIHMKTTAVMKSLAALAMLMTAGSASAEVGARDGSDQFSGFTSSRTRAEVQDEISNMRRQDASENNQLNGDKAPVGVYGVAGSRYSSRPESKEVGGSRPPWNSSNIYFGD
jgi:hypothetical protein